jgi:hypothetical protein
MPPSATPPLSLREPPVLKSYSDMNLQVELGGRERLEKEVIHVPQYERQLLSLELPSK